MHLRGEFVGDLPRVHSMGSPASAWVKMAARNGLEQLETGSPAAGRRRAGDVETLFEDLFRQQYATVVGIARRVLGDVHEAEDIAQDVFCAYHRSHAPDAAYAAAWLHRAAAHSALNAVRGRRRRREREQREASQRERVRTDSQAALDPQHELELSEERREVRAALARLPQKQAAVLMLRHSGLSYAAVAAALGVGTGQVGTLLRRAEAALHKEMTRETRR